MQNSNVYNYENNLIAFVDLLGFKEAVFQSETNEKIKKNVDAAMNYSLKIKCLNDAYNKLAAKDKRVNITVFSDCLVVTCQKFNDNQNNLYTDFLKGIVNMVFNLIITGFLVRGGITYGPLYHKDGVCYGPAMNRAYLLESKTAVYPRLLIDGFALKELAQDNFIHNSIKYISPDKSDGLIFLDYLSQKAYFEENDKYYDFDGNRLDYNKFLKVVRNMIIENLAKFHNDEKLFKKYQWYKKYYNDTVKKVLCQLSQEQQDEFLIK